MQISSCFFRYLLLPFLIALCSGQIAFAAEINVLSERQEFLFRPFLKSFEQKTGIRVNVIYMKGGALERVLHRPGAIDLVFLGDVSSLVALAEANLLQTHDSSYITKNIPEKFQSPEGLWTAITARARIFYYSRKTVGLDELSSYEDLVKPQFKGRICIRSGYHPYNIGLLSSLIAHHGENFVKSWLMGVKKNLARKPQGNDRSQIKAVAHGLCDIGIGNTYYAATTLERLGIEDEVGVFFPNQNLQGTHINISGAGVTRHARHKKDAVRLLEFLLKKASQQKFSLYNHEYPVLPGVIFSKKVLDFGKEQTQVKNGVFKQDSLSLPKIGKFHKQALRLLDETRFDY